VVAAVDLAHERALDRVPVPGAAVPRPLRLVEVPVGIWTDDRADVGRELRHAPEPVDDDPGADALALEEVAAEEEVPGAVVVAERVRVDRERVRVEDDAAVAERALRHVGGRHPKPVPLALLLPHGVVEVEAAVIARGHLRRPVNLPGPVERLEHVAERAPGDEVVRHQRGDRSPHVGDRSVGVVGAVVAEDEGVGEVRVVHRVRVGRRHGAGR
jgi:hypothetical protein